MNTTTVFSKGWIDIVFDGRNKAYGAYELRRINDRTLILAVIFSSALLAGAAIYSLNNGFNPQPPAGKLFSYTGDTTLLSPPIVQGIEKPKRHEQETVKTKPRDEHNYQIVDSNEVIEPEDTTQVAANTNTAVTGPSDGDGIASAGGVVDGDANSGTESIEKPENPDPEDWTDEMPEFPGGYPAFVDFISRNVIYLRIAQEYGIEGTVFVSFVVEKDGSITQVQVLRGIFKPLDEEAMRVVKMMPRWKPGKQNGNPVRVRYKVPISFAFND